MAGVMVSSSAGAMSSLVTKLTVLLGTEYQKHKRMQKEVALLKDELGTMNALLEMLEDIDELDPLTREWRNQVREAAYDIEDCVNNFIHSPTKNKVKVGFIQKIIQRFKSLRALSKFAKQFEELKAQVVEVSNRHDRYKHDDYTSMSSYVAIDPRVSALYTDAASLVGINGHVEELIKWLMDGNKKVKVVSILGIGGIGKTTLANQVYHKLDGQFDCKAFVSVSQKPDMTNLLNNILLEFGEQRFCDSCDVRHHLNKIRQYLQSKRYFVIIDDLWDTSAWEVIKCAFPENHHQSRVMTTTRIGSVAAACCNYSYEDIYNMKALTDQDARRLFFNRIFGSGGTCPPQFKSVSTEILKKCGGMPLAIITIASLLASQPNNLKEQWEYIRNSLGTSHGENPTLDGMRKILNLSYKNLPHCLKSCFLYVGIYPEDYTIKKDDLIKLWVAEGFVRTAHNDHDAYCVARGYFNELINSSMIQPILLDHNDEVLTCRVHDMILDLIISKSTDENLFTIVNDSKFMRKLSGKVRRLSFHSWITMEKYNKTVATICLSQVRSLVMLSYGCIPNVLDFRGLQVLILENSDQQDLTGICTLTQLRYFKIRTTGQFKLPTQIRGLQHLETFEIEKVPYFGFDSPDHSDIIVPSDIIHLPRLLHLIIPDQIIMPDSIGNLKSLQTLKYFDLGMNSLHNIESLQELTNLKDLHLSCSRGSSFVGYKDVLFPSLARLAECNLKNLSINHHLSTMCCDSLNGLFKSAHHLQRLCLSDWQFSRVPSWMGELNVLHSLELSLGKLLEDDVLILAEMPSLAHLHLHVRSSPKERIVISTGTAFIVLKHFRLICKTIPLTFEAGAMPKLQILELEFNAREMERQMELPVGIGHLSSLKQIHASIGGFRATQSDRIAAEFVFNNVMCIHPNHPCVDIKNEPYKFIDWDDEDEYM